MMERESLSPAHIAELEPLADQCDRAVAAGSLADLTAAYAKLWDAIPTPHSQYELRALAASTVAQFMRLGGWQQAAQYAPIEAEQYGADDPQVLINDAVITYNHDPVAGRAKLAHVLDTIGAWVFEGFREFLPVAKGDGLSRDSDPDSSEWSPMPRKAMTDSQYDALDPFFEACDRAEESGSLPEITAAYAALYQALPTPHEDYDLQTITSSTVLMFMRRGAWEQAAHYLKDQVKQYGPEDPQIQITGAVITYHLDPIAGREKLAKVLDTFGAWVFEGFREYLPVAKGGVMPSPPPNVPEDATELPDHLSRQIDELSEEGTDALYSDDWNEARTKFTQALELVPDPKQHWEAATWLYTSIGDAYLGEQNWQDARDNYFFATQSPGGISNPYIQLRLGECDYELGNLDAAAEELIAAYMTEGTKIFEDEPPKYLDFLRERGLIK